MMNMKKVAFLVALIALFFGFFSGRGVAGENARVTDTAVINAERELLLYFSVLNSFTEQMKQGVENGIPVTFNFFVELYSARQGKEDNKILAHSFNHTLSYDSLKEQYSVEQEEHGGITLFFQDITEAQAAMNTVHDFPLAELARLARGSEYLVKVQARLAKNTLPLNFQYIIPFWQLWKFETDWSSLPFTYGNSGSATER